MTAGPAHLGRPVGASGEQTRRRILTAAMRSVAEVGYAQASIREIARAAEMTSGSLYHYFANKSELLTATSEEIEDIVLPRLRTAATQYDDNARSPRRGARRVETTDQRLPLSGRLPARGAGGKCDPVAARQPDVPRIERLRDVISAIVEDAQARAVLSADIDAAAAVEAICALTRGLSQQAASLPRRPMTPP